MIRRLIPRPGLSVALFLLWAALTNAASLGQLLLGGLLALGMPFVVLPFWPDAPRLARPGQALRFAALVVTDIVVSNWVVARLVIGPIKRLQPAFVDIPLDLRDPFLASILGSIVSLTPGTVSVDIDQESWVLKIHSLDVPDPDALTLQIKQRYEQPIREIFAC